MHDKCFILGKLHFDTNFMKEDTSVRILHYSVFLVFNLDCICFIICVKCLKLKILTMFQPLCLPSVE